MGSLHAATDPALTTADHGENIGVMPDILIQMAKFPTLRVAFAHRLPIQSMEAGAQHVEQVDGG